MRVPACPWWTKNQRREFSTSGAWDSNCFAPDKVYSAAGLGPIPATPIPSLQTTWTTRLSAGGKYAGACAYLMEHAPSEKCARYGRFVPTAAVRDRRRVSTRSGHPLVTIGIMRPRDLSVRARHPLPSAPR
uniref:Uncharacterized protein n=1 Tax=Pseudomonas graminis TaxID=158627 RepID=A0A7C2B975_9PSED